MNVKKLSQWLQEIIEDELEEITSSGAAGPYMTPAAFGKKPTKKDDKEENERTVQFGESKFSKLSNKLSHEKGVSNPDAIAAAIGRKKYGEKGMEKKSIKGKEKQHEAFDSASDEPKTDTSAPGRKFEIQFKKPDDDPEAEYHKATITANSSSEAMSKFEETHPDCTGVSAHNLEGLEQDGSALQESRYSEYRMAEGTPHQKIGRAIREINQRIKK